MKRPKIPRICLSLGVMVVVLALTLGQAPAKDNAWLKINTNRFQALANFFNYAVLDRETGLVWQNCPTQFGPDNHPTWSEAMHSCWNAGTGGRDGWRLPTVSELRSLGSYSPNFQLPNSAPFCSGSAGEYWTSTTSLLDPNGALSVSDNGTMALNKPKSQKARIWCVRAAPIN